MHQVILSNSMSSSNVRFLVSTEVKYLSPSVAWFYHTRHCTEEDKNYACLCGVSRFLISWMTPIDLEHFHDSLQCQIISFHWGKSHNSSKYLSLNVAWFYYTRHSTGKDNNYVCLCGVSRFQSWFNTEFIKIVPRLCFVPANHTHVYLKVYTQEPGGISKFIPSQ